jgi:hypothetical protein
VDLHRVLRIALALYLASFVTSCRSNRVAVLAFNGEEGGFVLRPPPPPPGGAVADHMRPATIQGALEAGLWHLRYGRGGWRRSGRRSRRLRPQPLVAGAQAVRQIGRGR